MKRCIELPAGRLEYADEGRGRPILFLHGGHSNANDRLWHKGFAPSRYRLLTPSRPGYGRTPLDAGTRTAAGAADLMVQLLDALQIESAVVVGISAGGYTALELAARHPKRVEQLLLVSAVSTTWLTPEDAQYRKAQRLFRPGMERLTWGLLKGLLRVTPRAIATRMFGEFSAAEPGELPGKEVRELRRMLLAQSSGEGFLNDLTQQPPTPVTLAQISCPVLIQHSRNDRSVPVEHAHYAHAILRRSVLKLYDNPWGHLLWLGAGSAQPIDDARAFLAQPGAPRVQPSARLVAL